MVDSNLWNKKIAWILHTGKYNEHRFIYKLLHIKFDFVKMVAHFEIVPYQAAFCFLCNTLLPKWELIDPVEKHNFNFDILYQQV